MINKSLIFFVLYFNYCASSMAFTYEKLRIPVGGYPQEINIIKSILKLESCDKLNKLNENWNKVVMEFFILCKALYLGGIKPEFEFRALANYKSIIMTINRNDYFIPLNTISSFDINDRNNFFISDALYNSNNVYVGVYGLASNRELLKSKSLADLQKFTAITVDSWETDKVTLDAMKINYTTASHYGYIYKMINKNRADFTLLSFTNKPDLSYTVDNITLVPVPGIKVSFSLENKTSYHYVTNKEIPHAEKIFRALVVGIKQLQETNEIKQCTK